MKGWPAMKGRILLVAAVALALARPVRAADLTAAERAWVRTCVTGLTAPSLRQRESAAAALTQLGPAAVPAIAASTAVLKTDDQWTVLEAVLAAMGPADALKALEASVKEWPEGTAGRRQTLIDHLTAAARARATAPAAAGGLPPTKSPGEVAARVREILDSFDGESSYSELDSRVVELVRLGRLGVPVMLEDLQKTRLRSFRNRAATTALRRLLIVDDVPSIARLLDEGHFDVAPALTRLPGEVVVPVLLAPLARGFNAFDLVEALSAFRSDPRVPAALIAWLDSDPAGDGSSVIGSTAGLLEEADARAAVPSLLRALDRTTDLNRLQVAQALVGLGEKRGIAALLDVFRAPATRRNGYDRHAAGERLDQLAGQRIYRGRLWSAADVEGNFAEAIPAFDAWWAKVKDTIRFDPDRHVWTTK